MAADTDCAAELEADALEFPDERGEILLEAATPWIRAGEVERGRRLLTELVGAGGEDGCYARVQLIELVWHDDRVADAEIHLAALARDPALHDGHCQLVAELLAERGELEGALSWYDRVVTRLTAEELEAVRGPGGWARFASIPLRGRREVRRRLGLPPDATDAIVPVAPLARPRDMDDLRGHLDAGRRPPRELRVLTFQRDERAKARRRWPDEYTDSDEAYYPEAEYRWRELAGRGVPTIRVVAGTVAGLVAFAETAGGSPTDSAVRVGYAEAVRPEQTIAWPPPRNAPCWCGSGRQVQEMLRPHVLTEPTSKRPAGDARAHLGRPPHVRPRRRHLLAGHPEGCPRPAPPLELHRRMTEARRLLTGGCVPMARTRWSPPS